MRMRTVLTAVLAVLIVVGVAAAVLAFLGRERPTDTRGRPTTRKATGTRRAVTSKRRRGRPAWLRLGPVVLLAGAVVCLVLAAMRFTVDREETQATVVLATDVSRSMQETDVAPDRLTAAQDAARAFLGELPPGFRVGLVTFADVSATEIEPGRDRAGVTAAVEALAIAADKGTVIGDGLAAALDSIESARAASGERPAAVLLLSDGNDTGSAIPPLEAAERSRAIEVPVFTVALGRPDVEGGADAALLASIADTTGGEAFTALTAGELTGIYERLGTELSTRLAIGGSGPLFVALGALLAVAAGVLVMVSSRRQQY